MAPVPDYAKKKKKDNIQQAFQFLMLSLFNIKRLLEIILGCSFYFEVLICIFFLLRQGGDNLLFGVIFSHLKPGDFMTVFLLKVY